MCQLVLTSVALIESIVNKDVLSPRIVSILIHVFSSRIPSYRDDVSTIPDFVRDIVGRESIVMVGSGAEYNRKTVHSNHGYRESQEDVGVSDSKTPRDDEVQDLSAALLLPTLVLGS